MTTARTAEPGALREDEPSPEEIEAMFEEARNFRLPPPPPTPVRGRFYLTECEHCGWVGSSEHLGVDEDDISCPVCCSGICGDEPDEADTAKHGEAVYQRIIAAEADRDRLAAQVEAMRAERDIPAPEDVLDPEWGRNAFRAVLGENYRPAVWGKHRALNHASLKQAMETAQRLAPEVADCLAALIWNQVVVGNRAQHAFEAAAATRTLAVKRECAMLLLLAFVDRAAGEGLEFVADGQSPRMDAADVCSAAAQVLGLELGEHEFEALTERAYEAARSALGLPEQEGESRPKPTLAQKDASDGR